MNEFYDWIMIVMEDVSAKYSNTMWDIKYWKEETPPHAKPALSLKLAQEKVKSQLGVLHERGFVHGDVRDINVLVRNDDAPESDPDVLIVDWDWAGHAGQVVYPRGINTQLSRPEAALAHEEIKAEHDVWMVEHLL